MKINKILYEHYQKKISDVSVPQMPDWQTGPEQEVKTETKQGLKMLIAAALVLAFIPMFYYADKPSRLEIETAEFCRKIELNTRIEEGFLSLKNLASNSSFAGGKR